MKQFLYAQLNDNNMCVAISQLSRKVCAPDMVLLPEERLRMDLIGRVFQNGVFIEKDPVACVQEAYPLGEA